PLGHGVSPSNHLICVLFFRGTSAPRIARPSFPLAATGRCYRKHGQSPLQRTAVTFRVEPARAELAAQPGELALGELAGGEDRAVAEPGRGGRPVQVFPGLAVAHGAD